VGPQLHLKMKMKMKMSAEMIDESEARSVYETMSDWVPWRVAYCWKKKAYPRITSGL
jgi:hypothetical protein